jgi:hypothetical protein
MPGATEQDVGDFLRRFAVGTPFTDYSAHFVPRGPNVDMLLSTRPSVITGSIFFPKELDSGGLQLKRDIEIETRVEADRIVWRVPELQLVAEGGTDQEAEADLYDELSLLRDSYVDEPDESLTGDGQELKRRLREIFG